jgi:hypothetical protein
VKPLFLTLFLLLASSFALAQDKSFNTIKMPNAKGKLIKSVLTFKDSDKTVEIRPVKGDTVTIPYSQIDRWAYEFTNQRTIALTEGKAHWLEVDYHLQDAAHKILVLQMQKHDYIRILDAVKAHTGIDVDLEGNANKRH